MSKIGHKLISCSLWMARLCAVRQKGLCLSYCRMLNCIAVFHSSKDSLYSLNVNERCGHGYATLRKSTWFPAWAYSTWGINYCFLYLPFNGDKQRQESVSSQQEMDLTYSFNDCSVLWAALWSVHCVGTVVKSRIITRDVSFPMIQSANYTLLNKSRYRDGADTSRGM